jgi:hypothetical protein
VFGTEVHIIIYCVTKLYGRNGIKSILPPFPHILIPTNTLMSVKEAVYVASSYHINIKNAKMLAYLAHKCMHSVA